MVDISVSDSLHVVWMTVCLCCLWYWARHVSVFNFNIYLRWLIVGCGVQFAATYRKKINVVLKHASQKHTPQNAHSAEDLHRQFVDAKFMIFFHFLLLLFFLACDHANNTEKTWNPLNFCTNDLLLMIYLLQLLHCLCTPVFFCSYPLNA